MNATRARQIIRAVYPWPKWEDKVDKMSDKQVMATYFRLLADKKIKE